MTVLKIVKYGDERLRQKTKEITKFSKKIRTLVEDMLDTMYASNGVGLAAPQIGEALRVFVIDVSAPDEPYNPMVFVNPKIIKKSGALNSYEGCLSFPEAYTYVRRYSEVIVKAQGLDGKHFILDTKGNELLTKAVQHEFDHLNGVLFVDHARNIEKTNEILAKYNLNPIENDKIVIEDELEEKIKLLKPTPSEVAANELKEAEN